MRFDELKALCEKYPVSIPIREAAKFLGMSDDGLRAACLQGRCPFGFGWTSEGAERSGFKLPTMAFISWMTKGTALTMME